MREILKNIPLALRKILLQRVVLCFVFLLIAVVLMFTYGDTALVAPCAIMATFNLSTALLLTRRAIIGDYLIVSGACREVCRTLLRKRAKTFELETEKGLLQVNARYGAGRVSEGAEISLYITGGTPILHKDGVYVLGTYLAIDVKGGSDSGKKGKGFVRAARNHRGSDQTE